MTDIATGTNGNRPGWPVWIPLPFIAGVFGSGAVWSFREQTALAADTGFHIPELLPLTIDGFAVAMAAVAWSASLDGRAAVFARAGIGVGIAASAATNAAWAWNRSIGDQITVIIAAGVPVFAMVAFEVLLAEVRRQVQRLRGLPRPVPVPWPRLIRLALAPIATFRMWRHLVLERTDPRTQFLQEGSWESSTHAATANDRTAGSGSDSSRSAPRSDTGADRPRTAAAPTSRAEPAGSYSGTPTSRARTSPTSPRKGTTSSSAKRSDTELVSEIITDGLQDLSLNQLSSRLRVSKRRATDLRRAALEQTAATTTEPTAPETSPPEPSSSDPWAERADVA